VLGVAAGEGVQAHTENLIRAVADTGLPCAVFINKTDRTGSRTAEVCGELERAFRARLLPMSAVFEEGTAECRVSEPEDIGPRMVETLAECDDGIADRWLGGEAIPGRRWT
jgi:translation elongation factor EF-G